MNSVADNSSPVPFAVAAATPAAATHDAPAPAMVVADDMTAVTPSTSEEAITGRNAHVRASAIAQMERMGFSLSDASAALDATDGKIGGAVELLLLQHNQH